MTFTPIGPTAQTLAEKSQNADGARRGATGSAIRPQSSSGIAAWLGRQEVKDVDQAAVSRAKSHGVDLEVRTELRFPSGPNGEHLPSYSVAVGCDIHGTNEQRQAALADLENFQTPPEIRHVEDWLAELSVITASRSREGVEVALMVNAYSSRLATYPADIVKDALLKKSWKWWPTWDELKRYCDAKAGPRRHMIAALKQPEPDPEPVRRPPTAEERARIQAMIDEMFPGRDPDERKRAVDEALKGNCMTGEPS